MNTLYLSVFSYGLLILAFFRLPDSFWDNVLQLLEKGKVHWKTKQQNLAFFGEIHRGEDLLLRLQEAESRIALGLKILPEKILRYKFYTELLEMLFESYRRLGTPVRKYLPEIRKAVTRDLQFERRILNEILGALMQFLVIAFATWGFVFLSSMLVEMKLTKSILSLMLFLQIAGVALFFHLMNVLKKRTFAAMKDSLTELYLFTTLMNTGLPLNEVLKRSRILEGALMASKALEPFAGRTKKLIERLKKTGLSPNEEAQEILDGVWQFQNENFEKFTKKVQLLKFCILAFFFLPAYFLYLTSIFQFFMEQ